MNLKDIKHEGEQEAIRKSIASANWNIQKQAESLIWTNKKWRTYILSIQKQLEDLTVLFNSLDK